MSGGEEKDRWEGKFEGCSVDGAHSVAVPEVSAAGAIREGGSTSKSSEEGLIELFRAVVLGDLGGEEGHDGALDGAGD